MVVGARALTNRGLAAARRLHEWGVALGIASVGVGACLDQNAHDRRPPVKSSDVQRRSTLASQKRALLLRFDITRFQSAIDVAPWITEQRLRANYYPEVPGGCAAPAWPFESSRGVASTATHTNPHVAQQRRT